MSADSVCTCGAETNNKATNHNVNNITSNLTGVRLFKSMVRRVRQRMTESKRIHRSTSIVELSAATNKLDRMSITDDCNSSSSNSNRENVSPTSLLNGYVSDTGSAERRPDTRVRIRQRVRSQSKSDSRKSSGSNSGSNKKKPKTILRPPPTYIYVRGLSGIPTQRITVR